MADVLSLHPETPQRRFIERAAKLLEADGVVVLPTDSCYALTARPGSRAAVERICRIKQLNADKKLFSLIVPDVSEAARYAAVDDAAYRLLRDLTPGPYTFVLPATGEVPRKILAKRKTIGVRIPDHPVALQVAGAAGGGLLATTVRLPGDDEPLTDSEEIDRRIGKLVDLILEQGPCGLIPSTVVDLTGDEPVVLRAGAGDTALLE